MALVKHSRLTDKMLTQLKSCHVSTTRALICAAGNITTTCCAWRLVSPFVCSSILTFALVFHIFAA